MKKLIRVLIVVAILVGATVGYTYVNLRGPAHGGKALTEWLEQYGKFDKAQRDEAQAAIVALNPGVQPVLLEMLTCESSAGRQNLATVFGINYGESHIRRKNAARGFHALGAAAEPSIPQLVALLDQKSHDVPAGDALAGIGKPAVPALIGVIEKGQETARINAGRALAAIGPDADAAVSALISGLKDSSAQAREAYVVALGKIGTQLDKVIPAITPLLAEKEDMVQVAAAESLGWFGPSAKAAVPALLKLALLADNSNPSVAAAKSIRRIDPTVELPAPPTKGAGKSKAK